MVISTKKMTARQYLMLGEDPPGVRLELVDGQVTIHPGQTPEHSYAAIHLGSLLHDAVKQSGGEFFLGLDVALDEYNVRRPDLIFFRAERAHLIRPSDPVSNPPDLCVEIISPPSAQVDRKDKFVQYARAGVPYYWILDLAAQSLDAFENVRGIYSQIAKGAGNDVVRFPPFDRLEIPLTSLWFRSRIRVKKVKR